MGKLIDIIPVSDLRHDAAKILKHLHESNAPLIITQRGRAAAVMVSIDAYNKSEHDKELLSILAKGEMEIREGVGADIDTVMAEADSLLAQRPL